MSIRRRTLAVVATATAVLACAAVATAAAAAAPPARPSLADVMSEWPADYEVTGTKSEPLFTERISIERNADRFDLTIEVLGQGDAEFGTQRSTVDVTGAGDVVWQTGCGKSERACLNDPALRGFLATAALVSLERRGELPTDTAVRSIHGTEVICVNDAQLHPDAAPAIVRLDPCFDLTTGATLAHWSPDSAAFVGATLADGFTVTSG